MGVTVREFLTKWGFDVDDRKIRVLDKNVTKVHRNLAAAGKLSLQTGKRLSIGLTLPILGAAGAALKFASDAEETRNKFNEIFKGIEKEGAQAVKRLGDEFSLADSTSQGLLGTTGDLLVGLKLSRSEALKISESVVALSADVASFKNVQGGAEAATLSLTKALLGERESLKTTFGTALREKEVIEEANKIRKTRTDLTLQQAKAIATLNIVTDRNVDAIGDFQRTGGGAANQYRTFTQVLKATAEAFGEILLPPAVAVLKVLRGALTIIKDLNPTVKTTILIFAGLAAAFGPILIFTGLMLNSIVGIRKALLLMRLAGIQSLGALLIPLAKMVAIGLIVGVVLEDLFGFFTGKRSLTGLLVTQFLEFFNVIEMKFNELPGFIKGAIALALTPIRAFIATIRGIGGAIGALVAGDFSLALDAIKQIGKDAILDKAGLTGGLSQALGFGGERTAGQQIGSLSGVQAVGGVSNNPPVTQSISAPITISVPEGTPPDQVGPAVQKGIENSMNEMMRKTQRQLKSAVVN